MSAHSKNVLWAINDKCPYTCSYCYLRFDDESNPIIKEKNNIENATILKVLENDEFNIIFLAGAEPLLNTKIIDIVTVLKSYNKRVVICTNLIDTKKEVLKILLNLGVDAFSISLDSCNENYNDKYRCKNSWSKVVANIKYLYNLKIENNLKTKLGIYTVITKENLSDLYSTCKFCVNSLKIDYFIYQPITLPLNHSLCQQLTLDEGDLIKISSQIEKLDQLKNKIYLPNKDYNHLMMDGIQRMHKDCFINNNFIFIMPKGFYSNCPCFKADREIRNFSKDNNLNFLCKMNCSCFSEECSNIYQLINFDEVLKYEKR